MSVVRFYSEPVKFDLGWLDRSDMSIRQHLTHQGMLMTIGVATSLLYMKPDDMAIGLKSCVSVCLLELIRIILQYKLGTVFGSSWFLRMDELMRKNGTGVMTREIEKCTRRIDWALEWLLGQVASRDEEMETIQQNGDIGERNGNLKGCRKKSIADVLEAVDVNIDTPSMNFLKQEHRF